MRWRKAAIIGLVMTTSLFGLTGCGWFFVPEIPQVPDVQTVGFAPASGAVHTLVTVVGEGFGGMPEGATVRFGGAVAPIDSWSDTNIVVRIPVLATPTGQRSVTVEVRRSGALLGTGTFTVVRGVLFDTDRDGRSEIYVMNPDGSQQTNLTNHAGDDMTPVWSPDGTKVAFVSTRDRVSEIYVMNADGSSPANLTNHAKDDYHPVWSPDGQKIAFMTDRHHVSLAPIDLVEKILVTYSNTEIYVMNADGTHQTNLTNSGTWDGFPSWSPDGSKIVFQTARDAGGVVVMGLVPNGMGQEIYVMNADGTNPVSLSNSPGNDMFPMWSPVGPKIAFQSHRDGNAEIYVMNADGTGQMRLTNHPAPDHLPTWSPDGQWIAFVSQRDGNMEVYKVAASGVSTTRLTNSPGADWGPSWSPDGTQIAFQSTRDGNAEIYRMNSDGSSVTRLTTNPASDINVSWGSTSWGMMMLL